MEAPVLDDIDRKILDWLQEDSSITNVELARRLGLAPATSLDRVKKLKQRGVIRGSVVLVDPASVGKGTTVFVSVALASHRANLVEEFRNSVAQLPEVLECHHTSGEYDYLLKVVAEDIRHYEDFLLGKLVATPNVGKIHTSFVLSTVKHKTKIPIPPAAPTSSVGDEVRASSDLAEQTAETSTNGERSGSELFQKLMITAQKEGFLEIQLVSEAEKIWLDLSRCLGNQLSEPLVAPALDGSLMFTWRRPGHYLEIEIFPDGHKEAFYENEITGTPWEIEIPPSASVLESVLEKLSIFMLDKANPN